MAWAARAQPGAARRLRHWMTVTLPLSSVISSFAVVCGTTVMRGLAAQAAASLA